MSHTPCSAACRLCIPPPIFPLSHQTALGWKPPELLPRTLLLTPILPPEGAYLNSVNRRWRSLVMNYGKYPPLPFHVGKGNFYPQHRQEKAAPRDKNWDSSGAKQTCQRQLLFVNKYSAKDKASPLLHLLELFCDEWIFCSACLPGRLGLQECLRLCNFVS